MVLGERGVEELDDRDVEAVEPEHRLVGLVAVVVPRHRRRDDEVAVVHRRPLAVHGRVRAVAFEHEAQGALRVPVCGRDLARQHELHAGVEVGGDLRLAAQAGILEDQHAALGLLGGDQAAGLDHRRANLGERPRRRLAAADRLGRDELGERRPQRRHVLLADALVEGETLRRLGGGAPQAEWTCNLPESV